MVLTALIWVAGDIFGVLFPTENTAYMAHIFGIAFGAACGFYLRKKYSEEMSKRNQIFVTERDFRRWEDRWL
jgi:membrane associated rhomboid family serine protease